jgi:hypothetical protein
MRRPLIEKPVRHAPRHHHHHRATTPRGSWWVPSQVHGATSGASGTRGIVSLLAAPAESRLFAAHLRQRLLDDLGCVYDGHAVHIRDIDDWDTYDTWDDETAELDYAEVSELLK